MLNIHVKISINDFKFSVKRQKTRDESRVFSVKICFIFLLLLPPLSSLSCLALLPILGDVLLAP